MHSHYPGNPAIRQAYIVAMTCFNHGQFIHLHFGYPLVWNFAISPILSHLWIIH